MALPFIVGPHQCSLTQGPDGRPQVEVVLRIRPPLVEFFDALLLTLAEQHPLLPQGPPYVPVVCAWMGVGRLCGNSHR